MNKMSPKERAIKALTLKQPDYVPTMELEFQTTYELFHEEYYSGSEVESGISRDEIIDHNAKLFAKVLDYFDYAIAMVCRRVPSIPGENFDDTLISMMQKTKEYLKEDRLFMCHGDATYAIPDGNTMLDFVYNLADHPDKMKDRAKRMVEKELERDLRLMKAGFDGFALCSDYAFNKGSFLSPAMFGEFIAPYLEELIREQRKMGAYVIKHTDGDIMPIIDQIVDCKPHALHSLDPQGGIDVATIKKLYGDRICLIGGVNCGLMQTGTKEQILESARYAMESGKPGGGYIFSTSNVVFKGMPLESYLLIYDYYLKNRDYL